MKIWPEWSEAELAAEKWPVGSSVLCLYHVMSLVHRKLLVVVREAKGREEVVVMRVECCLRTQRVSLCLLHSVMMAR